MKVLGITAEYDPFHNGHLYHLQTAKATVSPDAAICVMSGDFTQRGEPAVLDKWKRAAIAVEQGLDLVLELPFLCACSPAASFASGAVDILLRAGATHISFGCEAEDPKMLEELARGQIREAGRIEELTRLGMKSGLSHVKARQNASSQVLGEELTALSLSPNNILALEYLKRMFYWQERGVAVEPVPVLRKGSGYKEVATESATTDENPADTTTSGAATAPAMAGGSAIRTMIEAGWDVSKFLPYEPFLLLSAESESATSTAGTESWINLKVARAEMLKQLKGIALRTDAAQLSRIRFIGEGIENRLIREIGDAETYEGLLKKMTSKRYTTSTIRRMLICILLGITKDQAEDSLDPAATVYGRILAMNVAGRRLVAAGKQDEADPAPAGSRSEDSAPADPTPVVGTGQPLPFIANINRLEDQPAAIKNSIAIDVRAADLYNLITGGDTYKLSDHRQKPCIFGR